MLPPPAPARRLRDQLKRGDVTPRDMATDALAKADSNAARNVYLYRNPAQTLALAAELPTHFPHSRNQPPLYGLPVSIKDCFDLQGVVTTCGSTYYAQHHSPAKSHSWIVERLQSRGAVITGKTHLHQLAYGITGENPDYGDCTQPANPSLLTGGSSSGAAASIQEGSAIVAIGTDTGGSIRVPAALCGIAGYRASLGVGDWRGGAHLAPSFDTIGILFQDLRDAHWLGTAVFDFLTTASLPSNRIRIGAVHPSFLHDCEPKVLTAFKNFQQLVSATQLETGFWEDAFAIFSPIQAHEAARLHHGSFPHFEKSIRERLEWGASIPTPEIQDLRLRHHDFQARMNALFESSDFLICPCAPIAELHAGADNTRARAHILRYTTPASLAGIPVVAIPFQHTGIQLMAAPGADAKLLAYAAGIGEKLAELDNAEC